MASDLGREIAPTLVLMYHRIGDSQNDLSQTFVRPDRFKEHLEILRGLVRVVPISEALEAARSPRVILTFDDGYADNAEVAALLLRRYECPATFFVTTKSFIDEREFWWDRLGHILLDESNVPFLQLTLPTRTVRVDIRTAIGRRRALRLCVESLYLFDLACIDAVIEQIERQVERPARPCSQHRRLSPEQIQALHDEGLVEIGAHGCTHESLAALSDKDSRREIEQCRDALWSTTGKAPRAVAYPFGVPEALRRSHFRHARELGFEFGFTTTPCVYRRPWFRFQLPRVAVMDWDRNEFTGRISSLLA